MASFFDPETKALWASVIFAAPGFADCETSEGTHIKVKAALDPRDGAAVARREVRILATTAQDMFLFVCVSEGLR